MTDAKDEFWDDAQETFPGKEDLKDRLVAVWALEKGQDKNADGKVYATVQSITLVLDDGPEGWQVQVIRDDEMTPNRVPSVTDEGPQELALRWSTEGMVSRLGPRVGKTVKPMLGRINSRPNKVKGRSASWSISSPTEEDYAVARQHGEAIKAIIQRMEKEQNEALASGAFDA